MNKNSIVNIVRIDDFTIDLTIIVSNVALKVSSCLSCAATFIVSITATPNVIWPRWHQQQTSNAFQLYSLVQYLPLVLAKEKW